MNKETLKQVIRENILSILKEDIDEATIETNVDDLDKVKRKAEDDDTIKVVDENKDVTSLKPGDLAAIKKTGERVKVVSVNGNKLVVKGRDGRERGVNLLTLTTINEYHEINTDAKFDGDNLGGDDEPEPETVASLNSEIKRWEKIRQKVGKPAAEKYIDGLISDLKKQLQALESEDLNEVSSEKMYQNILKAKDLDGVNKALGNPLNYTIKDINKNYGGLGKFKRSLVKNMKKHSNKGAHIGSDFIEESDSLEDEAKAYYLAKVKKGEIDSLPENPKEEFLAQMTKDQIEHDDETLRRERGLEEIGKNYDPEKDDLVINTEKLQKLTAKMRAKAKEYKEAEGKAKEKIKDELKKLTKEKKALEATL